MKFLIVGDGASYVIMREARTPRQGSLESVVRRRFRLLSLFFAPFFHLHIRTFVAS